MAKAMPDGRRRLPKMPISGTVPTEHFNWRGQAAMEAIARHYAVTQVEIAEATTIGGPIGSLREFMPSIPRKRPRIVR